MQLAQWCSDSLQERHHLAIRSKSIIFVEYQHMEMDIPKSEIHKFPKVSRKQTNRQMASHCWNGEPSTYGNEHTKIENLTNAQVYPKDRWHQIIEMANR